MLVFRRRLVFWIVREYVRKWGKRIVLFFFASLILSFLLWLALPNLISRIPVGRHESIGIVGAYTVQTLPDAVVSDLSYGLTIVGDDGIAKPGAATAWKIENSGKSYTFSIKKGVLFSDTTVLTADTIPYAFSEATIAKRDPYTVTYTLQSAFSPFLTRVSKPMLRKGLIGIGAYKVKQVELNGDFVQSITLAKKSNPYETKKYRFFPTNDAIKVAFALGELSKASGLSDDLFQETSFSSYKNTIVEKTTSLDRLVTVFYNTRDSTVSSEKLRIGLTYALPDTFPGGRRHYTPFSPASWAFDTVANDRSQDLAHAKNLLSDARAETGAKGFTLTIKTLSKYQRTAEVVATSWEEAGVQTKIETVDSVPDAYQVFLGDFLVENDPDQYTLWHKDQINNITGYSNLRIDKLLEDGRQTTSINERKQIYANFQKYFLADPPASFLYFPEEYTLIRK